jgi:hypothetical protein
MDARYEGPTLSRFLSEDPNFILVGASTWQSGVGPDPALTRFVSSGNTAYLGNPQNLNSYSYVNNNPLRYTDPTGKCPNCATALAGGIVGGIYGLVDQYLNDVGNNLINGQG